MFVGTEFTMSQNTEMGISGKIRLVVVAAAVLMQLALIILLVYFLRYRAIYAYIIIQFIALVDIVFLAGRKNNRSFIIAWLIVISVLPVFGHILYLMWGRCPSNDYRSRRMNASIARGMGFLEREPAVYSDFQKIHPGRKRFAGYLGRQNFPLYTNTKCDYYPLGELQFDAMFKDMEKAKKFIFMEYFILSSGSLWNSFEELLIHKAKEGVEVRLMFDDLGSISRVPKNLVKKLGSHGILVQRFNPVLRHLSQLHINYRNHQKIAVIDGNVAYTGGTNMADEYANLYVKYGHWKDTAIRLEGDAVWSLTVSFIQMWDSESKEASFYDKYKSEYGCEAQGFFQPFSDGPANNPVNPAEVIYRKIINSARDYVYIMTPYLVIDNNMMDALCSASMGGTDVRIITPKIFDQWYVHKVTRSNYEELLRAGVRIYEYTPGFIHAKTIISDDDHAVTGTINMDYRSFYMHYENGVWICGAPVLEEIKKDMIDTMAVCEEMELEKWVNRPFYIKALQTVMRLFAVLF